MHKKSKSDKLPTPKVGERVVSFWLDNIGRRGVRLSGFSDPANKMAWVKWDDGETSGEFLKYLGREKDYAKISIEDSGIGISKEDIPFIFNRFYMVDKVRTGKSFGLGLSIVKWILDIHGGNIDIDSEPGTGTKMTVRLPVNIKKIFLSSNA